MKPEIAEQISKFSDYQMSRFYIEMIKILQLNRHSAVYFQLREILTAAPELLETAIERVLIEDNVNPL